jgi:putative flippase GtrA
LINWQVILLTKLIQQFLKFGVVGVICFFIDTGLYTICNFIGIPYLISGVIGFSVSVVVNYLLSMKYVFVRRDDLSRKKEFIIYLILSIIGLILNELILFVCVDVIYGNWSWLRSFMHPRAAEILAKIGEYNKARTRLNNELGRV